MTSTKQEDEGKLLGAISLRYSQFSPDAIAGITPIELMLEINEFDNSTPLAAAVPDGDLAQTIWALRDANAPIIQGEVRPIATPLSFLPLPPDPLNAFSSSSMNKIAGAIASTISRARRTLLSD